MKHLPANQNQKKALVNFVRLILPMLALVSVLMLSAGCASPSASTVQPWPGPPPAGYAMLMIYWPKKHWDEVGGGPSVYIDEVKAFKLHINHYSWVYVRAGSHNLSTVWGFKIFGWNPLNGLNMKKEFILADGETCHLKMQSWSNGGMYVEKIYVALRQVDGMTAKKEAATCWFTKPLVGQINTSFKPAETNSLPVISPQSEPVKPDIGK